MIFSLSNQNVKLAKHLLHKKEFLIFNSLLIRIFQEYLESFFKISNNQIRSFNVDLAFYILESFHSLFCLLILLHSNFR
jgi:hypothetical protein